MGLYQRRIWQCSLSLLLGLSLILCSPGLPSLGQESQSPPSQPSTTQPSPTPSNGAAADAIPNTGDISFNGVPIFQIAETDSQTVEDRVAIIQNRLDRNLEDWLTADELPDVTIQSGGSPTLYVGSQEVLTVTAQDALANNVSDLETLAGQLQRLLRNALKQSRLEQSTDYRQRALVSILGIFVASLLAHVLSGMIWRRYLRALFDRLTFADSGSNRTPTFSLVDLFLSLTLVLVRGTIWTLAIIHSTRFFLVTQRWSQLVRHALVNSFTAKILPLGDKSFSLTDFLTLLLLLFAMVLATQSLTNLLRSRVLQAAGINRGVQEAVAILARYLLLVIGCIMILQIWGLDLSSLTLLASALGIGIGLGLQNIAKDIGSGLVLVFERPIQVGEFIEFDDYMGVVERIGVRSTEIRTLDQVSVIVPNSRFLDSEVTNWSHRNPLSRIHVPVGVAYKSDPEQVRQTLLKVARAQDDVLAAPAPQVFFQSFGDNSLNFDLLVWTRNPSKQPKLKSDLNFAIAAAFHENDIEIPFPQRDVHFIDGELPVGLNPSTQALLLKLIKGD